MTTASLTDRVGEALRRERWLLAWLGVALLIAQAPYALSACCAAPSLTGLGSVWFVNDFAQYESAMRQGAERSDWLVRNPFTAEPHSPAFMFPLYVAVGKVSAALGVADTALLRLVETISRAVFVVALWRFARLFSRNEDAARAAFLLALFGSGLGIFAVLIGRAVGLDAPYAGNWSYETNTFGLLFAAPHVPLGLAATLELARWLAPSESRRHPRWPALAGAAALGVAVALLHPFHAPVLFAALVLAGGLWWRAGQGWGTLAAGMAASIAALPALAPTVYTFSLDPFWGATYTTQNILPSPAPHELLVDLGVTLVLALVGLRLLGARAAPFGLLLWLLLALLAMYLPVPYQRRLSFGVHPALAVVAANGLVALAAALSRRRAAALRLGTVALAGSGTLLVALALSASAVANAPLTLYRSTPDLDAGAAWLNTHANAGDVILADWDTANYLAPRSPASVFGGHPVATLNMERKRFIVVAAFAHGADLEFARGLGATWVVSGPAQADLPAPDVPAVFQAGSVRVYRLGP